MLDIGNTGQPLAALGLALTLAGVLGAAGIALWLKRRCSGRWL